MPNAKPNTLTKHAYTPRPKVNTLHSTAEHSNTAIEQAHAQPIVTLNLMPTRLQLITKEIKFHVQHVAANIKLAMAKSEFGDMSTIIPYAHTLPYTHTSTHTYTCSSVNDATNLKTERDHVALYLTWGTFYIHCSLLLLSNLSSVQAKNSYILWQSFPLYLSFSICLTCRLSRFFLMFAMHRKRQFSVLFSWCARETV